MGSTLPEVRTEIVKRGERCRRISSLVYEGPARSTLSLAGDQRAASEEIVECLGSHWNFPLPMFTYAFAYWSFDEDGTLRSLVVRREIDAP